MSSSGSARGGLPVASKPGSASGPLLVDCVSDAIWFAVLVGACVMPSSLSSCSLGCRARRPQLYRWKPPPYPPPQAGEGTCACNPPQAGDGDVCIIGAPSVRETSSPA